MKYLYTFLFAIAVVATYGQKTTSTDTIVPSKIQVCLMLDLSGSMHYPALHTYPLLHISQLTYNLWFWRMTGE